MLFCREGWLVLISLFVGAILGGRAAIFFLESGIVKSPICNVSFSHPYWRLPFSHFDSFLFYSTLREEVEFQLKHAYLHPRDCA